MEWEEQLLAYPPARKLDRETLSKNHEYNIRLDNYPAAKSLENPSNQKRDGRNALVCPALLEHHKKLHKF